jgi:transcriptional regulator with XRE-family HTH domain
MGTSRRPRPARLATKLRLIRMSMDITQAEMFKRLGDTGTRLYVGHIDDYEKDRRVPTLQVVLAYARVAGISMEAIVDDALDLPDRIAPMRGAKGSKKRQNKIPR